jgi:hypothetical protein
MLTLAINTHAFPIEPEGDLEFCNGRPGSALADWLRTILIERGFAVQESLQEDYGWGFWLNNETAIWIAVGLADDSDDGDNPSESTEVPTWFVIVSHEAPIFSPRQWFRRREGRELAQRVFQAIEQAVGERSDMEVEEIR